MSLRDDLRKARKAQEKLDTYCKGLPKGSAETKKYLELNSEVNKALNKLPKGMRSYAAIDLLGR